MNIGIKGVITTINSGDIEKSIELCKKLIEDSLNYCVNTEYYIDEDMVSSVSNFMIAAQFIKETDPSFVGVWRNRLAQAQKYPYQIESKDDLNKELIENIIPVVISSAIDVAAYGQVLLKARLITDKGGSISKIEMVKVPNFCYARNRNKTYKLDTTSDWYKENHKGSDLYIYYQDNDFFTGGIMRALLLLSLAKQSNLNNWFNGNNGLFGATVASYNYENLEDIAKSNARQNSQDVNNLKFEDVSGIAENALKGFVNYGRIAIPDAIKLEAQKLIDSGIGASFDGFIQKADELIEVAITGISGTIRNSETGSFAKAKVQYLVSDSIRWMDMDNIEAIVKLCIETILPHLTATTKPKDMIFAWVLDEETDTTAFLTNIATAASLPLETEDGKGFAITVGDFYKGANIEIPEGYLEPTDLFILSGSNKKEQPENNFDENAENPENDLNEENPQENLPLSNIQLLK